MAFSTSVPSGMSALTRALAAALQHPPRPNDRPGPLGPGPISSGPAAIQPGVPHAPRAGGGLRPPAPPTDMQLAQQQVSALLDPLIKNITNQENARALAGQQAIAGYTRAEQNLLSQYAPQVAGEYAGAEQGQNAIDAALRASLTGAGGDAANQLGAKLAAISADPQTTARVNAAAGQTAQGAANTGYALGSASLSSLGQQGAAGEQFAGALPGIAGLTGLQSSKALQSQVASELAKNLGDIQSQAPGIIQNVLGDIQSRKAAQAKLQADQAKTAADQQIAREKIRAAELIASGRISEGLQVANMANQTRASIANANNSTRVGIANANRQSANQRASNADQIKWYQAQTSRYRATHPSSAAPPRLSALQIQKYRGTAATIANNAKTGFTDAKGTAHPALNPAQAWQEMRQEGVPTVIAIDAINRAYGTNFNPKGYLP